MIEAIARSLQGKKQSDGSFMVLCPAHADKNPSLHVTPAGDTVLVNCKAGCTQDAVMSALKSRGLWPEKLNGADISRPAGIPSKWGRDADSKQYMTHWPYYDANGDIIGYVARYENAAGKDIIPFFKRSGETWKPGAATVPRPLYNLNVLNKNSEILVLIVEGEKTADAARILAGNHYTVTTWPNGSGAANKADWSPLKGREVVMWPDADEPGHKAALMVQEQCRKAGAKSFQIVKPPADVKPGWDMADAKAEGWTTDLVLDHIKNNSSKSEPLPSVWEKPVDLVSMLHIQPGPIAWFARERIIQGRGFLLTGVGGSSKTRLLYHLAAGAILGRLPWSWEVSIKGRAVLVLTEDTADDVHRTIYNLSRSLGLSLEDRQTLYQSLVIYPLAGEDTILLAKTGAGTLEKSSLFLDLIQKIKDLGDVVLVGMDPALSLTDGDELDQGNQRALGKMADDLAVLTGAAVGLVTHATKGSLNQDTIGSHNSRGGGAITDAARTEFVMRTMTTKEYNRAGLDDPEDQFRHVQLVGTKGNYLPPSAYLPVWLRRDDYGMLSEANISLDQKRGPSEKDMGALSLLKDLAIGHDRSLKAWRESCVKNGVITSKTDEAQIKAMKRIIKSLKGFGLIEAGIGKGIWLATHFNEDQD